MAGAPVFDLLKQPLDFLRPAPREAALAPTADLFMATDELARSVPVWIQGVHVHDEAIIDDCGLLP